MTLETLALLGEFVGGSVVVVSLIYLAFQVNQNTRSLRAENYARVLERMSILQARLAEDGELNRIVAIGAARPGALTRAERIRFTWAMYELFGAAEFMFHQSLEKDLPPLVRERWAATTRWWLSFPGIQAWWAARPTPLSSDFEAYVDDIVRNGRFDHDAQRRWRAFVDGDDMVALAAPSDGAAVARSARAPSSGIP